MIIFKILKIKSLTFSLISRKQKKKKEIIILYNNKIFREKWKNVNENYLISTTTKICLFNRLFKKKNTKKTDTRFNKKYVITQKIN